MGLSLRRYGIPERMLDPTGQIQRHLEQLLRLSPPHLPNRIFNSPPSMLAPSVSRLASTRGSEISRR